MPTIGVDAHKRIHMAVAVDGAGREVSRWRGANSVEGWGQGAVWAAALDSDVRWGGEGAWDDGRGLAQQLVATGATVYEVNPRWTAEGRRRARRTDKNERLDAPAVALLVGREATSWPLVAADDETAVLALLITEREAAIAAVTRLRNQAHQRLLQLDPGHAARLPRLRTKAGARAPETYTTADAHPLQQQRAAAVRRLAQRLCPALEQARDLARQIRALAAPRFAPLVRICGIELLTAAALAGILGPGRRFATEAQLAAYAGVAPVEASSAARVRHRLNRGGNRRLKAILYRVALTQTRASPLAQAYLARRISAGRTRREASRALKRHLVRVIWRAWQECQQPVDGMPIGMAA